MTDRDLRDLRLLLIELDPEAEVSLEAKSLGAISTIRRFTAQELLTMVEQVMHFRMMKAADDDRYSRLPPNRK